MNRHALSVLEFRQVLENVASRASSELGRERVMELFPGTRVGLAQAELQRVEEMARFLDRHRDWPLPDIPDARSALARLGLEGSVLEPLELYSFGRLLTSGGVLKDVLSKAGPELSGLATLREELHKDRAVEKGIQEVVDRDGTILDSASRELGRIRARFRQLHGKVVQALEKLLRTLPDRIVVPDASVTIREGRYVIPIRREGRREVGGAVLDESATGATLFVEPPLALEMMSELRELQREEAREILRILREQTDAIRPSYPLLEGSQEALVAFDSLYARARAALAWEGTAPTLLPPGTQEMEIVDGRHPLLLSRGEGEVVPFDLSLEPGERVLVVSGPNTGGKSVFLKALGLIAALAQSGVIPPVGKGTRFPLFSEVFADIGDEQSIVESLSTFSAHLANLREIVGEADRESLVLIDEMGTGTDPQEGAALSRAILEDLVERGTLTVVTSHLGALKRLDTPGSGVVNASLQFDPDRIEPTYQLLKGRPGRSYGLAIARRLGFPLDLLDRAEGHLPKDEARMEELLATLEREEMEAARLVDSLALERAQTEHLKEGLQEREEELKSRERTARARAQEEARQLLLDARREVEDAIKEVRAERERAQADQEAMEAAERKARRMVEEAARRHSPERERNPGPSGNRDVQPGDRVSLTGTGSKGTVVEIREGRAVVEAAGVRLQLPATDLVYLGPPAGDQGKPTSTSAPLASSWQGPEAEPQPEVDVRGFRVSEVGIKVDRALDQAILAGLGELRIIHGKGTGALRESISELLANDSRVSDFRMGGPAEGGAGVTIVRLR
ncbi:MAG: endonuclease MutS2 [Gemmatimonadota bacterium]